MDLIIAFKHGIKKEYPWWKKLLAGIIKKFTGSKYYHCEFIYGDYWYSVDFINGVKSYMLKPFDNINYDYINFDLKKEEEDRLYLFIATCLGDGYDWLAIFVSLLFKFGYHRKNKWTCSELCGELCKRLSLLPIDTNTAKTSPGGLYTRLKAIKDNTLQKRERLINKNVV